MDWPQACAVVIPCFDEAGTIAPLVVDVGRHLPTVWVVDDGSTDDSGALAAQAGARVIRHPANLGKGVALRTGLSAARDAGFGWALTMDGDGQHHPQDIPAFLRAADASAAALVVGNRMHNASAIPRLRRFVNRWMSRRLSRLAGRPLPDSQCGFRLLRLDAWSRLSLATEHFEVESETLLAFIAAGHAVAFVPIQVVGRGPRSKIRPLTDTVRWFRWWRRQSRR
jgi:glycosyltransferase involved in cell wall biosynthesis